MTIEQRLSDVLRDFARTLGTDFPIQSILDHLVLRIVDVLPVTAAGVTLISPGVSPRYVAASNEAAMRYERLQTELDQGPCLTAYRSAEPVLVPDLASEARFPAFTQRALAEGLKAVFTFPLRQGDHQLGALDLYRTSAGGLDDDAFDAAQTLADVATAYLVNAQAREDLVVSAETASHTALHDALTGLPNRALLVERLARGMLRGKDGDTTMAILYADLDDFKEVNERYGHEIGDRLLVAVAERLKTILHTTDTLARLASDEFVILREDVTDPASIEPFASFLGDTLAAPFVLGELEVLVTASVGIAVVGPAQLLPEVVLRDAGTAMSQAKKRGGANHGTLDRAEQQLGVERATLLRDLRGALARSELLVEYQPIVSTSDGSVRGAEALLRWDHPRAGRIRPDIFIPIAETCGVIVPIGSWVMDQACRDRDTWQRPGERPIELAVNVSAHQFVSPGFVASVAEILDTTGISPELLTLEVTESIFLQDGALAVAVFDQLKGLGVKLSLDDFGTGYSSLSYLSRFPIDTVKIDRSFVVQLAAAPTTRLVIAAVVDLAHGMDMDVIAEGVETEQELDAVRELGCDFYQGYYFAASMPTEAFRARIG